jgi:hypothetical protein
MRSSMQQQALGSARRRAVQQVVQLQQIALGM